MRIIALLATYNEERFIASCISHFVRQGVEVYLLDNGSTDRTVSIAESYLGRGLVGMETIHRDGSFALTRLLKRKEELAQELRADWFMHVDADERHAPPPPYKTLHDALMDVEAQGYNAVNFLEYTFVPTREAPDHDHAHFQETMRWYYPFLPAFPHRLNAWKRQSQPVELTWSAGHKVRFPALRMYPESFSMPHYLVLSREHAMSKYISRQRAGSELKLGWGRARQNLQVDMLEFPPQAKLRTLAAAGVFDPTAPWTRHFWDPASSPPVSGPAPLSSSGQASKKR